MEGVMMGVVLVVLLVVWLVAVVVLVWTGVLLLLYCAHIPLMMFRVPSMPTPGHNNGLHDLIVGAKLELWHAPNLDTLW